MDVGGGAVPDSVSGQFEIAIEPRSHEYDDHDDRWRNQVIGLYSELRAQVDAVQRSREVPGMKGTLDELIVALGSAGAFTATVECLRAWLGRDRSRRIDVRWDEDGAERFVTLTGDAIDVESVQGIAAAAARRVGGKTWPAGTGPS
jgi:Effector Associated Constant Component 1